MLEIKSDNKGLLLPRIDFNNRPDSPVAGLVIYVNANGPAGNGIYYYDGTGWLKLGTSTFYLGMQAAGGVVFYLDSTGQHGMAAASFDQGSAMWGCDTTLIGPGAQHFEFNTGDLNTAAIVAACPEQATAAKICDTLVMNGYSDWFLPSADELDSMWTHRDLIGGFIASAWYWSSTEWDSGGSVFVNMDPGWTPYWICSKSYFLNVRCVRKF
ncbi:MAG TPA: hypothetical protein PKG48_13125 [Bacteroidales bacterium]|nr:hypothetical protein [Bacteroidales bacterium]HPS61852.1 hypothetical protein [Bacteroidales bacterium]